MCLSDFIGKSTRQDHMLSAFISGQKVALANGNETRDKDLKNTNLRR